MPSERKARFVSKYGLSEYDARILVTETALADFYEAAVAALPAHPKPIANWMTGELLRRMREENVDPSGIRFAPDALAALVRLVESGKVSGASAKAVLVEMWQTGGDPEAIVNTKGLLQVSDESAIAAAVDAVLAENPKAVADYRAGKPRALGALVGPVMKRMGGKVDPAVVNRLLAERIAASVS